MSEPLPSSVSAPASAHRSLPIVCLAGPTASGKTAAALALADELSRRGRPLEIISVDSALVFRQMDIGTAKPSATELAAVPHHLIDIRDPLTAYSAAEFVNDTHLLIDDIRARGAVPLLVGGTMLYFKALFDGIDDMPAADPAIRAEIDAEARQFGWASLHARLTEIDAITAARLAPADSQRIQRALEVWRKTGRPLSSFHSRTERQAGQLPQSGGRSFHLFSLEPDDRRWLHRRIEERFQIMLDQGLVDEVRRLRERGDLHPDLPSMRCVGYRQTWDMLDGRFSMTELPERGIAATRQLAKRQITWLRSMGHRQAIACDAPGAQAAAIEAMLPLLDATPSE